MVSTLLILASLACFWAFEKGRRKTHPVPEGFQPDIDLPYTAEFELYHNALSLCSMKSRVCMAELRIPYVSHHIDLVETGAYENIRPEFLTVNPGGTVPLLVHQGHPIYESHEQIRYAAAHAPAGSPSLTPDDPTCRSEMEEWIDRSSLTGDPMKGMKASAGNCIPALTLPLFVAMVEDIPYWKIVEGVLFHFDKRRPILFIVMKLVGFRHLAKLGPMMSVLAKARVEMGAHLDALEETLSKTGGPWILGETFSLADVSWLVIFERLAQADYEATFYGGPLRPRCAAYWKQLKARNGYAEAILEHAHPTVVNGTSRLKQAKTRDVSLRIALEGE